MFIIIKTFSQNLTNVEMVSLLKEGRLTGPAFTFDVSLKHWNPSDSPLQEHANWKPQMHLRCSPQRH